MKTNAELLHDKGVIDKEKLSAEKIDAINSLSNEEVAHIEAALNKLSTEEKSAVEGVMGVPI